MDDRKKVEAKPDTEDHAAFRWNLSGWLGAQLGGTCWMLILAVLIGAWLVFQVIVNLGMVLGWLPTTGVTLPLFSYGGSSLISTCAALGVVQSVWRHRLVNQ